VARIIVKDTVEERILALQEQKIALAAAALGDEPTGRIGRLNIRELVGLFGKVTKNEDGDMQIQQ
jgi:SNF2 family DNA or RNA helicase